jgi:hypothetical protein
MAHGYLREFDEAPDRGDNRDPQRDDERERSWRGGEHERDRNFMLGDRERGTGREDDRFREQDRQFRSEHQGDPGRRERSRRNFSSHQDDHYRSWRDRQMEALDRDYEDYCREREHKFHSDFDSWRRNREQRGNGSNEGIAERAELELTHERALSGQGNTPSPIGEATLGTNNSENTGVGRANPSG